MTKAYSYIRFSSAIQAQGDSLRRQVELSEKYAAEHGLILDKSLTLRDEGLSGFTGENRTKGALAVFLKAVECGIVAPGSYLLVESLDRLSRDTLTQQMNLFMNLINAGIVIVTLTDGQVLSQDSINSDFTKIIISLVVMIRAHEESLMKSKRLKAVWKEKRKNAEREKLTSQCPAWLVLDPDHKKFTPNQERVQILQRIFQMSLNGVGHHSIARTLNAEGITNWGRGNNGWHVSYIRHILQSRAVIGEYQPCRRERGEHRVCIPDGDPIRDYYPAVIDLPTWQAVQDRRKTNTPGRVNPRTVNLFAGVAFDGDHGCAMRFMSRSPRLDRNGKRDGRWHYLVSDYGRLQAETRASSWRYEWFEAWFLEYICRLDWDSVAAEKATAKELQEKTKIAQARSNLERIDSSLSRLAKLAASTDTVPTTLMSEMIKIEKEREVVATGLLQLEKEAHAAESRRMGLSRSADKVKKLVASHDPDARLRLREEIRMRVDRIDIYPNGASDEVLKQEHVSAPGWPCFKISFANGATRWVICPSKKPAPGSDAALSDSYAPNADTNSTPKSSAPVEAELQAQQPLPNPAPDTTAAALLQLSEVVAVEPEAQKTRTAKSPKPMQGQLL